jgi:light-harvesting complex II chlorophyll a/b binding protein 4
MLAFVSASPCFVAPMATPIASTAQRATTATMQQALESPIPGMPRPAYLDGTLAADAGLDPLNFVTKYGDFSVTVPGMETSVEAAGEEFKTLKTVVDRKLVGVELQLGPNTQDPTRSLMWMREAEIKHARLAMLAAAGWPLAELWHGPLSKITSSPYALEVTQGRSLSVLNGGLGEVGGFLFVAALAAAYVEVSTLDNVYGLTAKGLTMKDNGQLVVKSYSPGDCGFDPLGLYGYFGNQLGGMERIRADADPNYALELAEASRKEMETAEIKNGRLAMLAITGFAFQEFFWGTPVVDQTPIFFTFFGDILAPGALGSLGLF